MIITVDFDGTCVTHEFPLVGRDIGAQEVLRDLVARGDKLILYTMRSGGPLVDAIRWFRDRGISLYGINGNPTQHTWTSSPKVYAEVYIDDASLGAPLIRDASTTRPYIDWDYVRQYFFGN